MNVDQEQLNKWRQFAETVRNGSYTLKGAFARHDRTQFDTVVKLMHDTSLRAALDMESVGAERPSSLPAPSVVPLRLLNTPTNQDYLRVLEVAYDAALAVDHERGFGDNGPAQFFQIEIARVRQEIGGPVGSGLE